MLYQSIKLTNGIWVLCELKIAPGNQNFMVSTRHGSSVFVWMYVCKCEFLIQFNANSLLY